MVTEVCIMKVDFEVSWVSETSETNLLGCSGQEVGSMMIVNGFFYTCYLLPTAHLVLTQPVQTLTSDWTKRLNEHENMSNRNLPNKKNRT